jgi:hypothetical protein
MQDELGGEVGFSQKMSLKRFRVGACKLGIEHQDAGWGEVEAGTDSGVSEGQPGLPV